jgi:hypothetical protein
MSISRLALMGAAGAGGAVAVEDAFSTDLYTGNGSTQTITNGIDLAGEGGLVWVKSRSNSEKHGLQDTLRGAGNQLPSNEAAPTEVRADSITAFNSDGFTLGADTAGGNYNVSGRTQVAWTFRKAPKFFDIVTYTGDGTAGREIPHNLGVTPGMVVVKSLVGFDWQVYHKSNTVSPETDYLLLNTAAETADNVTRWNDTLPSETSFTVGSGIEVNSVNGYEYVAYLFAHNDAGDGIIQCGSYTGNGSATGPTITLGWKPQYVLIKRSDGTLQWFIYDNARSPSNPRREQLKTNSSQGADVFGEQVDFLSGGFQPVTSDANVNQTGSNYIYMAIRAEGT